MKIISKDGWLRISPTSMEAEFLVRILSSLSLEYETEPAQLNAKLASAWYSTHDPENAEISEADIEDWNDQLFQLRGENKDKIEKWITILEGEFPLEWTLSHEDAETFLMVINDYRLVCAANHHLDDAELEHDFESVADPERRLALFEIHFLAWIMEKMMEELSDSSVS